MYTVQVFREKDQKEQPFVGEMDKNCEVVFSNTVKSLQQYC
jgi:hypothetical protein